MSQQLVMTPQLQQAIRLLQLSRLELIDEIRKELDANPVLADEETDPRFRNRAEGISDGNEGGSVTTQPAAMSERLDATDLSKRTEDRQVQDIDWDQFLENRSLQQPVAGSRTGFDEFPSAEQNLTRRDGLVDHLRRQLEMSDFVENERRFAELILGNLDDNGYLDLSSNAPNAGEEATPELTLDQLAEIAGLNPEDAPYVLRLMQEMDPVGACCRDLAECLRVQAEVAGYDELELTILDKHLVNLEKHNYQLIARDLKVPLEEVYEAVQEIQKLESRPARNFNEADEKTIAITPDVYVVKDGDKFMVSDNDRGVQRLYVNEALTKQLLRDPQAKDFIGEKLRNAQWLIRAIEQRRKTIVRVTECIVEKQRDFFERGVAHLKPMILRDVAETVGMHESTISRVTTNKYVHTPQGIFELKYFFNSSIRRASEDDIASESVKQAIKKIVDEENKSLPYSDQQIVEMLSKRDGIQIARRTVAKYRDVLGIISSSKRKKVF